MVQKHFKSGLFAVAIAMIGFSWALATAPESGVTSILKAGALQPGVGTGLHFSNPFLLPGQDPQYPNGGGVGSDPQGFDLGDVCYGSQFVRYLTAAQGVQPWHYSSTTSASAALTVSTIGRVFGLEPAQVGTSANLTRFIATVGDPTGATRTGSFLLTPFPSATTPFRFAQDRLSDAQVGQDYTSNIQVLNGNPLATFFSVVPGSVTLNGTAQTSLTNLGLQLFLDGALAGRPLQSGTLKFTAHATSGGNTALNRAGSAPDQALTIQIAASHSIQSVLATATSAISVGSNRDGFNLTAYFNSDGKFSSDYAGLPVTLRVGNQTFSTALDGHGNDRSPNFQVRTKAPTGTLSLGLRHQSLATLFGSDTLADGSLKVVPIEIQIGDVFLGTEAVEYSVRNRNGHITLRYNLNRNRQVGGLCQITTINAADVQASSVAYQARVLIAPPVSQVGTIVGATNATVNIGQGFSESLQLFNGSNRFSPPGVSNFRQRGRFVTITTYGLPATQTGIVPSFKTGGQVQTFLLGLEIISPSTTFDGEATRRIFPF